MITRYSFILEVISDNPIQPTARAFGKAWPPKYNLLSSRSIIYFFWASAAAISSGVGSMMFGGGFIRLLTLTKISLIWRSLGVVRSILNFSFFFLMLLSKQICLELFSSSSLWIVLLRSIFFIFVGPRDFAIAASFSSSLRFISFLKDSFS